MLAFRTVCPHQQDGTVGAQQDFLHHAAYIPAGETGPSMRAQGDHIHGIGMGEIDDPFRRLAFQKGEACFKPFLLKLLDLFLQIPLRLLLLHMPAQRIDGRAAAAVLRMFKHMDEGHAGVCYRSNRFYMRKDAFCQCGSIQWHQDVIDHNSLQKSSYTY